MGVGTHPRRRLPLAGWWTMLTVSMLAPLTSAAEQAPPAVAPAPMGGVSTSPGTPSQMNPAPISPQPGLPELPGLPKVTPERPLTSSPKLDQAAPELTK